MNLTISWSFPRYPTNSWKSSLPSLFLSFDFITDWMTGVRMMCGWSSGWEKATYSFRSSFLSPLTSAALKSKGVDVKKNINEIEGTSVYPQEKFSPTRLKASERKIGYEWKWLITFLVWKGGYVVFFFLLCLSLKSSNCFFTTADLRSLYGKKHSILNG